MTPKVRRQAVIILKSWVGTLGVAFLIAMSFKSAIADWNVVPTGSMKPTIVEGDRILVNKLAYDLKVPFTTWHVTQWGNPRRGDIVVFYSPQDGKRMVKRVVGLPGDEVAMLDNRLFINGQPMSYEPIAQLSAQLPTDSKESGHYRYTENLDGTRHPVMITPRQPAMRFFGSVEVPDGHYFMMGDNRDNSADSRYFGFVERREIVGQATAVVVSLDIHNRYRPRWERFFTSLP